MGGPEGCRGPRRTTVPGAGAGADVLGGWSGVHAPHVQANAKEEDATGKEKSTRPPRRAPTADHRDRRIEGDGSHDGLRLVVLQSFGFSLALPVLSVVSSLPGGLISAAIIAFGMHQAWQMTGIPALEIPGPFGSPPDPGDLTIEVLDLTPAVRLAHVRALLHRVPALALACPACSALVHRERLQELADRARLRRPPAIGRCPRALAGGAGLVPSTQSSMDRSAIASQLSRCAGRSRPATTDRGPDRGGNASRVAAAASPCSSSANSSSCCSASPN